MLNVSIVVAFQLVFWQMHVIEQSVDAAYLSDVFGHAATDAVGMVSYT
jgi:hypothetical protein